MSVAKVRVKLPLGVTYPDRQGARMRGGDDRDVVKAAIAAEPRLEPASTRTASCTCGVFVNDRNMRALGGFEAPVSDGDVIRVLPPIAGG